MYEKNTAFIYPHLCVGIYFLCCKNWHFWVSFARHQNTWVYSRTLFETDTLDSSCISQGVAFQLRENSPFRFFCFLFEIALYYYIKTKALSEIDRVLDYYWWQCLITQMSSFLYIPDQVSTNFLFFNISFRLANQHSD